ncbi:hypothetical protein [Piscinibacter sp.]|jgi:hypothetical protein|uniref:hypothetical protein n=1 Tax=Piscinibacter sp. TaxID=1903157 RepID=UPI002F3E232A
MHSITIQTTLAQHGDTRVVTANDAERRSFVGVAPSGRDGGFVFVQVDRVTLLELERGMVDGRTVMAERCAGIVVEATGQGMPQEVMRGVVVRA